MVVYSALRYPASLQAPQAHHANECPANVEQELDKRFSTPSNFIENKEKVVWKSGKSSIQFDLHLATRFRRFSALSTKSQTCSNGHNIRATKLGGLCRGFIASLIFEQLKYIFVSQETYMYR